MSITASTRASEANAEFARILVLVGCNILIRTFDTPVSSYSGRGCH